MFDILTVILLVMIAIIYLLYIFIWKWGTEAIEGKSG